MIIHCFSDGSVSYEYQVGDRVIVKSTIHGGWFDIGPTNSENCIVKKIMPYRKGDYCRYTNTLHVWYSNDWGLAECKPWQVIPHKSTLDTAVKVAVDN